MKSAIVEIRPQLENPKKVDFFVEGKILTNVFAERVFNVNEKLTAEAIIIYDKNQKTTPQLSAKSSAAKEDDMAGGDIA